MRLARLENRADSHDYLVIGEVELLAEPIAYGYSLVEHLLNNATTTAGVQLRAMVSLIDTRIAVLLERVSAPTMPRESLPAAREAHDMDSGTEEQRIEEFKEEVHGDLGRIRKIGDVLKEMLGNVVPTGGVRSQNQHQHDQSAIEEKFKAFHSKLNELDTAPIAALGAAFVPEEWQDRKVWWNVPRSMLPTLLITYPTTVSVLIGCGWINSRRCSVHQSRY